jgi:hypothetical protein
MNEEDLQDIIERLKNLEEGFGAATSELQVFTSAAKKGGGYIKKSMDQLNKDIKKGNASFNQVTRAIDSLDDAISELGNTANDGAKKAQLLQKRKELVQEASNIRTVEATRLFTKNLLTGSSKLISDLTNDMQRGAGGVTMSTTMLKTAIDFAGGAIGIVGTVIGKFGESLSNNLNPLVSVTGGIVSGIGAGITYTADQAKKLMQFGVDVLSKELEKTNNAFNTIVANGAVFAGGLTAMREASVGAGLTLQQFSKVISQQSQDLAMSGMSVAEGARMVGATGRIFDQNNGRIRTQLLNLGYGFEEQAEITATVMGNIRRTAQSVNPALLASETQKLGENMRLVAALTGEDAKAKTKQVQEQNQIAAFQNKLAQMGPKQAAQIDTAMAQMTAIEQKAFRDRVIFNGSVINKDAAIYEATNAAAAEKGRLLYGKFLSETFDATAVADANAQYSQAMVDAFRKNQALFVASYATGDSSLSNVSAAGLDAYNQAIKFTKEAVETAKNSVKTLKDTTDPLTTGMKKATTAAQQLANSFENLLTPLLKSYAQVAGIGLNAANDAVKTFEDLLLGKDTPSTDLFPKTADGFPDPFKTGLATGGISTGPVSGYTEVLHGTEAVVPLPDNKTIPVSLDSSSITASLNQQTAVMSEVLRTLQKNNNLTSQIAQNSY